MGGPAGLIHATGLQLSPGADEALTPVVAAATTPTQETRKQDGYGAKGELAYNIEAHDSQTGENVTLMNSD